MRSAAPPGPETDPLAALDRVIADADPAKLPGLLGDLERLKLMLWQRLLVTMAPRAMPDAADPAGELRHLTPHQVAETLSLKAAYVHELCRTGRLPAVKSGKYWMIPVAGLRRWLAYQNRDVDGGSRTRLESPNPLGTTCRMAPAGQAGRARRAPVV